MSYAPQTVTPEDGVTGEAVMAVSLVHEIVEAHEATITAGRSALEHARRAGELLIQAKAHCGHGEWLPWLAANVPTIAETAVQGYMRVAKGWSKLEVAAKAQRVTDLPLRDALKLLVGPRETHNSGEFEWYSPREYVEAARAVMGGIDLDPASTATANEIVKATTFYDVALDGLQQPWHGKIWMNPPYTNALMTAFIDRLLHFYYERNRQVSEAVVLTNNATDTGWFHTAAAGCQGLCLPRGRAHYWRGDTRELSSALQGQAVLYFGPNTDRFAEVFGEMGLIVGVFWRPSQRVTQPDQAVGVL